jgi:rifampicin phosphotransferase
MDRRFIVGLGASEARDAATVGGKAAGLAALHAAGFPVPDGVCVTCAAYHLALEGLAPRVSHVLGGRDLVDPDAATAAAQRLEPVLAELHVPTAVGAALRDALGSRLDAGTPFAVRSSATAEDQTDTSFAGQYATVLGVRGEDAVLRAIAECWRSFFSANALAARAAYGALSRDEAMAVLVMPMLEPECAGVAFSVDPVHRSRDHVVIESAWGLGIGTVDGSVAGDTDRVYRRSMRADERHVVEKLERIVLSPSGGTVVEEVPEEQRRAACLGEGDLVRIAQFAIAAERLMGRPQDVEWAIVDRKVRLLQSRPLTALPSELTTLPAFPVSWSDPADARRAWHLGESSLDRVPQPLEHVVYDAFNAAVDDAVRFRGSTFFPPARMLVLNGRRYMTPLANPLRPGDVRVRDRAITDLNRRLLQEHGLTAWEYWGPEVVTANERLAACDVDTVDLPGLAEHLEDALGTFRRHWMVHWLLWPPPLEEFGAAHAALTGAAEPKPIDELATMLEGEETPLTRLIDGLYDLGTRARAPALAALVRDGTRDALERLRASPEAADFVARFGRFLDAHGDRTGMGYGSSADLRNPTWREDPTQVLALIAPYLDETVEAPAAARARVRQRRDAEIDALCEGKDEALVREFRRQLALARKDATLLEEHNHHIDQLSTAYLRRAFLACGRRLVARGLLDAPDDVYWLQFDEILLALRGDETAPTAEVIDERRRQAAEWEALEPPPLVGVPDPSLRPRGPFRDDVQRHQPASATALRGVAASPGRHRGRARVVTGTDVLPRFDPGDVLVAANAGPLWTPFFPLLGALVLDHGGITQHSAATAREYGIPAVLGTRNATRRVRDGSWLTVDGDAGTVELETSADDLQKSA